MSDQRILIIIGDPALEAPEHRAMLRARFTTIVRHVVELWNVTKIVNPLLDEGPNRWVSELGAVLPPTCVETAYPKGRFELGWVRNTRLMFAVSADRALGAKAVALYFKGPWRGIESADDLARKCKSAGIKVIDFDWHPDNEAIHEQPDPTTTATAPVAVEAGHPSAEPSASAG